MNNIMEDEELDLKLSSIWKDYPTTPSPTSTSSIKSFDGRLLHYNSYKSSSVASIFGGKQDFGGNPTAPSVISVTNKQILHPPKFFGHVHHSSCIQNQQHYTTNCFPSTSPSSTYGCCNHHPIHHYYNHMKRNNFEFHQLSRSSSQSSGFASYNNCTPSLCGGGYGAPDPQQLDHYHRCNKNIYENMIYQEDNMANFDASLNRSFNIKNSNIRASTPLNSTSSSIGKSSSSKTCHTNSSRKLGAGEVGRFGRSKSLLNSPGKKVAGGHSFSSDESEDESYYNEDMREIIKKSSKYTEACKNIESDQDQESSTFLTSFTSSLKLKSSSSRKHYNKEVKGIKTQDKKDKNVTRMKKIKKVTIDNYSESSGNGFLKNFLHTLFFPMSIFLNIILLLLMCCLVFNEQLNLKKLCFSILHISFEYFKKIFPFDLPTPFYSQNSTADYYYDETFNNEF